MIRLHSEARCCIREESHETLAPSYDSWKGTADAAVLPDGLPGVELVSFGDHGENLQ